MQLLAQLYFKMHFLFLFREVNCENLQLSTFLLYHFHFSNIYFFIQVTNARLKLENIGSEIKNIKQLVWGLVSVFLPSHSL